MTRTRTHGGLLIVSLATLAIVPTGTSQAQQKEAAVGEVQEEEAPGGEAAAQNPLVSGARNVWGFFYGFGIAQEINRSEGDINTASVGVRWSHLWSERGSGFFAGHPAFGVEVQPLLAFLQEPTAYAIGFNVMYEHHFAAGGRFLPIWRIGAGALYSGDEIPRGETRTNFSLLTALALHYMIGSRTAFEIEYRLHHISNAETGDVNPGINAHTVFVGFSLYR